MIYKIPLLMRCHAVMTKGVSKFSLLFCYPTYLTPMTNSHRRNKFHKLSFFIHFLKSKIISNSNNTMFIALARGF